MILDSRAYTGSESPFDCKSIVICSLNFAAKMKDDIRSANRNIVVIDEAHKLRNAHQLGNKTGQAIRFATEQSRKILLTATPLQNSLMELYGMSSLIDEYMFGEPAIFRANYTGADASDAYLKGYVEDDGDIPPIDLDTVLKAAGLIGSMCKAWLGIRKPGRQMEREV